jgi:hypothetical protein
MLNIDRHIAIQAGWIAGPAFGVAMMAAPEYLHLGPVGSGLLFWGGLAVFFVTIIVIGVVWVTGSIKPAGPILAIVLAFIVVGLNFLDRRHFRPRAEGPNLEGNVIYTFLGQSDIDGRMAPGIIIFAAITNIGSVQTIAINFSVSVKKDRSIYEGAVLGVTKAFTVHPIPGQSTGKPVRYQAKDALYNKAATPIPTGGIVYGYLMVAFKNISDYSVLKGGYEVHWKFNDAFSNQYYRIGIGTVRTTELPAIVLPGLDMEVDPSD